MSEYDVILDKYMGAWSPEARRRKGRNLPNSSASISVVGPGGKFFLEDGKWSFCASKRFKDEFGEANIEDYFIRKHPDKKLYVDKGKFQTMMLNKLKEEKDKRDKP